jgi:hypothetical protein
MEDLFYGIAGTVLTVLWFGVGCHLVVLGERNALKRFIKSGLVALPLVYTAYKIPNWYLVGVSLLIWAYLFFTTEEPEVEYYW